MANADKLRAGNRSCTAMAVRPPVPIPTSKEFGTNIGISAVDIG